MAAERRRDRPPRRRLPVLAARRLVLARRHLRRLLPYLVGAAMFGVAVWMLATTLARYRLADLHAELAQLGAGQVGLAMLFSGLSFVALIGYEWSALGLVGRRLPLPQLALASFVTQSIAHSTGFAVIVGASLRYHFYAARGLTLGEVAKVQVFFTATFTLGIATLAGAVVAIEPGRLAHATGLPGWLWRGAAMAALLLVAAYVVWGALFHRPLRWRGREFVLPGAGATLTQIFFGVADLMAVAAALHMLLPGELGLSYAEVLTIFMASILVGLASHVPGSLGVFESAVILLVQPPEAQILPLIGALLAFRAVYYILPLVCGAGLLTLQEMHRWREPLARFSHRWRLDLGPAAPDAMAVLAFLAGLVLLLAAMLPAASPEAVGLGTLIGVACGLGLLVLARSLAAGLVVAWRSGVVLLAAGLAASLFGGGPVLLTGLLLLALALLLACRHEFRHPDDGAGTPLAAAWLLLAVTFLTKGT